MERQGRRLAIQGSRGLLSSGLVGSYSKVVGLPLAETAALLAGQGYHVHRNWGASAVR
jgi:septum formation protein